MKPTGNSQLPVLIVDDEPSMVEACEFVLHANGVKNTIPCLDGREVMKLIECPGTLQVLSLNSL